MKGCIMYKHMHHAEGCVLDRVIAMKDLAKS